MANTVEYPIKEAHKEYIARTQHVLEWLQSERARLSDELRMVSQRGASLQSELLAFIGEHYRIPAGAAITFDSGRGVLSRPTTEDEDDDTADLAQRRAETATTPPLAYRQRTRVTATPAPAQSDAGSPTAG